MSADIGQNIKAARTAAGLTQEELAKKCGLATITIRQYESGRRSLNIKQLAHVARAIGVDWADLVPDPEPGEEEEYIVEEDRDYVRKIRPHLAPVDPLTDEESALKTLLNSMGYDIMKTRGNYFFTYESGGSEISKDDLCELLNCAQNGLKIAAKTLELKLLREAFGPRYPDEIVFPPPAQPPAEATQAQDTPAAQDAPEGAEKPE